MAIGVPVAVILSIVGAVMLIGQVKKRRKKQQEKKKKVNKSWTHCTSSLIPFSIKVLFFIFTFVPTLTAWKVEIFKRDFNATNINQR